MSKSSSKIMISSTPEKVWEALTKPELVKQWQYGSDIDTDWQVGSEIRFTSVWEGNTYEQWGKVLEFSPHSSIRYSLFAPSPGIEDKPENYFTMSYILTSKDGLISLEIIKEDNRLSATTDDTEEDNETLITLKKLVETTT